MKHTFKLNSVSIDDYKAVKHGTINITEHQKGKNVYTSGITGLFGENGTGKSTLCKCINMLVKIVNNDNKHLDVDIMSTFKYSFNVYEDQKLTNRLEYKISFGIDKTILYESIYSTGAFEDQKQTKYQEILNYNHIYNEITPLRKCKYYNCKNISKFDKDVSILNEENFALLCANKENSYTKLLSEFRNYISNNIIVLNESSSKAEFDLISEKTLVDMMLYKQKINSVLNCVFPNVNITIDGIQELNEAPHDVKRKVCLIYSYIKALENPSYITVVDELDSGLHEYILQILLQTFINTGKGQLIFTSNNLRPLEILPKESVVFTTTNSNCRYYKFSKIRDKNNLRDCYYDEIEKEHKKQEQLLFTAINSKILEKNI